MRTAHEEVVHKQFVSFTKKQQNTTIAQRLIDYTLKKAELSGIPYFIIDEKAQKGNSFGERLANAFSTVFEMGYQKVISIGSDCPSMHYSLLKKAANQLQYQPIILGPTFRKGIYLLGLDKSAFNANQLANIPWQTPQELQSMMTTFDQSIVLFPQLHDWNSANDLSILRYLLKGRSRLLAQLFASITIHSTFLYRDIIKISQDFDAVLFSRPPPYLSSSF